MATRVLNLMTGKTLIYTCKPREAVMAAYAQSKKDNCTWDYEKRYGSLVQEHKHSFSCGDFSAVKEEYANKR